MTFSKISQVFPVFWAFPLKPTITLIYKKLSFLRHFRGKIIWDWNMNLGCKELGRHSVFVVCDAVFF
jgi:hypothetical protein